MGVKPWYLSKTIITSGGAFAVAIGTGAGLIDADTGVKIQGILLPMIFTFLRIGDKEVTLSNGRG
jgi:hypothetical protein